jgi:hypothetical protein
MLLFKEDGRLGNQLFQYAALRTLAKKNENLILLNFSDLQATFENINAKIIGSNTPKLERSFYYRLFNLTQTLSQKRLISTISESCGLETSKLEYTKGILKILTYCNSPLYCQGECFFDLDVVRTLTIKNNILKDARALLDSIVSPMCIPIFVHIRRGDYLIWPDSSNPAVLPVCYYYKCIHLVRKRIKNSFFIFLSDDLTYVEDHFGSLTNSHIHDGSKSEDFTLMTQCKGGILSASSFSWWAAYLGYLHHQNRLFLAPKYWVGHRTKTWFPPLIKSRIFEYIDAWHTQSI